MSPVDKPVSGPGRTRLLPVRGLRELARSRVASNRSRRSEAQPRQSIVIVPPGSGDDCGGARGSPCERTARSLRPALPRCPAIAGAIAQGVTRRAQRRHDGRRRPFVAGAAPGCALRRGRRCSSPRPRFPACRAWNRDRVAAGGGVPHLEEPAGGGTEGVPGAKGFAVAAACRRVPRPSRVGIRIMELDHAKGVAEYFRTNQRRYFTDLLQALRINSHIHIFINTSIHPVSLERIVKEYLAMRGWAVNRVNELPIQPRPRASRPRACGGRRGGNPAVRPHPAPCSGWRPETESRTAPAWPRRRLPHRGKRRPHALERVRLRERRGARPPDEPRRAIRVERDPATAPTAAPRRAESEEFARGERL